MPAYTEEDAWRDVANMRRQMPLPPSRKDIGAATTIVSASSVAIDGSFLLRLMTKDGETFDLAMSPIVADFLAEQLRRGADLSGVLPDRMNVTGPTLVRI